MDGEDARGKTTEGYEDDKPFVREIAKRFVIRRRSGFGRAMPMPDIEDRYITTINSEGTEEEEENHNDDDEGE